MRTRERSIPGRDGVEADPECVVDRGPESEECRVRPLEQFEPASPRRHRVVVGPGPVGGAGVEHGRTQAVEHRVTHVQESGAPRRPEELAPGRADQVAADLIHIDGELTDRLAGVEQVGNAGGSNQGTGLGDGIDEPALARDMGERDECHATPFEPPGQRVEVDLAVGIVGQDLDLDPDEVAGPQHGQHVGDVLGPSRQHRVAALQRDRTEGEVPRPGRALGERDLIRSATDEPGDRVVDPLDPVVLLGRGPVAADLGLESKVFDDRIDDRLRRR